MPEEWIDVEAGEDGCRESLVRPMALNGGWTHYERDVRPSEDVDADKHDAREQTFMN